LIPRCKVLFAGQDHPPYKYKGSWPIETYPLNVIINFILFSPNLAFQPPLLSSFVSTMVEGVLSGLPISGQPYAHCSRRGSSRSSESRFSKCLLSKAVRPAPRQLDRPVLGGSASGFPTTARCSAFVCSIEKSVNTLRSRFETVRFHPSDP
jgi:hypothetical protein